MDEHNSF
jgi:hypothetical protein